MIEFEGPLPFAQEVISICKIVKRVALADSVSEGAPQGEGFLVLFDGLAPRLILLLAETLVRFPEQAVGLHIELIRGRGGLDVRQLFELDGVALVRPSDLIRKDLDLIL